MGSSCSFSKKSAGTTTNIIKLTNTNNRNNTSQRQSNNFNVLIDLNYFKREAHNQKILLKIIMENFFKTFQK